jgi:hypothetical protein
MTDSTPDKVKNLLEAAIKNSTEAWAAQSDYFDDLIKRHVASFAALSDARIESLKTISESLTFNQAFEANIEYEQTVRKALEKMQVENAQAWTELQQKIAAVYAASDTDEDAAGG